MHISSDIPEQRIQATAHTPVGKAETFETKASNCFRKT